MMEKKKLKKIALPALRGIMGDWIFYSCLMDIGEINDRVKYAKEIHNNKQLSDMIQRKITPARSEQIAQYLKSEKERFFNSLVVATYGGEPSWYALSDVRNKIEKPDLRDLSDEAIQSLGFLTLRGDESLFALDGQHRLSGIRRAIKTGLDQSLYDDVSVIFVGHQDNQKGLERTRRLFTTLNKTARPVSKGDIIALDEDDVMAICVRQLIEKTKLFGGERIAFVASNNMPVSNFIALTTISNLYDVLTVIFTSTNFGLKQPKAELKRVRPSDEHLKKYFEYAEKFFQLLMGNFSELNEFFSAANTTEVVKKYRGRHGGNALFRPIGLEIFVQIIARLSKDRSLSQAVKLASKLPRELSKPPYESLMWEVSTSTISNSHKVTLREVLLYMCGCSKYTDETLLERYRRDTDNENAQLPNQILEGASYE